MRSEAVGGPVLGHLSGLRGLIPRGGEIAAVRQAEEALDRLQAHPCQRSRQRC